MALDSKSAHVAETELAQPADPSPLSTPTAFLQGVPEVMTLQDLVALLRIPLNTARADLHRKPEALPPRLLLPGRRVVRFLKRDVADWLLAARAEDAATVATPISRGLAEGGK